jgi:hypothetical protein
VDSRYKWSVKISLLITHGEHVDSRYKWSVKISLLITHGEHVLKNI